MHDCSKKMYALKCLTKVHVWLVNTSYLNILADKGTSATDISTSEVSEMFLMCFVPHKGVKD